MVGSDYEGDDETVPTPKPVLKVYTAAEKLAEIKSEIALRRRVYGRLVQSGGMKEAEAAKRIGVMEQIAADYRESPPPLDLGEPT
jgi:hypothetical protein